MSIIIMTAHVKFFIIKAHLLFWLLLLRNNLVLCSGSSCWFLLILLLILLSIAIAIAIAVVLGNSFSFLSWI